MNVVPAHGILMVNRDLMLAKCNKSPSSKPFTIDKRDPMSTFCPVCNAPITVRFDTVEILSR